MFERLRRKVRKRGSNQSNKCDPESLLPYGYIVTTRKAIDEYIDEISYAVTYNAVYLISIGLNGNIDYLRLYSVCSKLFFLEKLLYAEDGVYKKLKAKDYIKKLFEGLAETPDEIESILNRMHKVKEFDPCVDKIGHVNRVFQCLNLIEMLWCRGISRLYQRMLIPELAYAFEYVILHKGKLPKPEFENESSLFPSNYVNYDNNTGLAEYYMENTELFY